jgi:hypothetical protein
LFVTPISNSNLTKGSALATIEIYNKITNFVAKTQLELDFSSAPYRE